MSYNVLDSLKHLELDELKTLSKETRLPFSICLLNLEYDLNIGNCIRSAHIFGAETVFIFGKRKYDSRSTVGAHNYINVVKYDFDDLTDTSLIESKFDSMIQTYNLNPLVIEKTDNSIPITFFKTISRQKTPCLVFGNEQSGVPTVISDKYQCFEIPQRGVIRSLNVASAAAVAIYEFSKYY